MRFESLWIQVYHLVSISGSLTVFSFFSLFLNSKEDFQRIFLLSFLIAEWFFVDGFIPFYSTFLGFFGVPLIPSICYPGYQNKCCVSNIGGWSLSYFLTIFSFWSFPSKSLQLTFLFFFEGGVLRVDFQSFLPKAFRCHFSDPPFGCFIFCHFL